MRRIREILAASTRSVGRSLLHLAIAVALLVACVATLVSLDTPLNRHPLIQFQNPKHPMALVDSSVAIVMHGVWRWRTTQY